MDQMEITKAKKEDLQEILDLQYVAYQSEGLGKRLLKEVELCYPGYRYELFTSTLSVNNIRLYESMG